MGASLDTPARCPLCDELTRDPVTLKCNHRFCQRCLGDLWSVVPTGPYHCPEFRCKTVYQTLPFGPRLKQPPGAGRRTQPRRSADAPKNDEQSTVDSLLTRPSLTRLLGKRKAGPSAAEQPDAKRSSVEPSREQNNDTETPGTSLSDDPEQPAPEETPQTETHPEPQSEHGDGSSSTENSDRNEVPPSGGDATEEISALRSEHTSISVDDSDSSNEVDICDAPLPATSKKDTQVTGACVSPKKSASPANNSDKSAGASNLGRVDSPVYVFPKRAVTSLGPPSHSGSPVPCHYCPKAGCQHAVKTCLVCGASMCKEHLRPHLDSPVFQNHTLVPPVEDISLWRCQEHQEINRIYCRQCGVCVCTVCTVIGSHRDHACVSIREAERELRGNLNDQIKQLQDAEQRVKNTVAELTQKKDTARELLSAALVGVQQQYGAIREALDQEEQSVVQCVTKEEKRVLGGLEEKLCHLQSSLESIRTGLQTLDSLAGAKGDGRVQDQAFIVEYAKIAQMTSCLQNGMEEFETPEDVDRARLKCLERWTERRLDAAVLAMPGKDRDLYSLLYGIIPHLDANTAHPKLQLRDNNRRVIYTESQQAYTEHEARFTSFPQVLATCALEGGRWYWEVGVSVDDGRWKVGLCEGRMERKGQRDGSRLGFNGSSWCLACDKKKVEALHDKASVPLNADGLRRVGVFLDFEEGVLSFFNVTPGGSLVLMHSYKQRFSGPLYPAMSVSKTQLAVCEIFQS
ncbi:E3 ubiquitin/ISG15 ligase TRIM25 [Salarias fasciatus]|uniref:E3 ubiquitin/ISG15 ligase TRIM25-like n=1 Tax=Salarias fasciatus TaxID=181472 RepID=A0A672IDA2_SALFA|nr:E3 ubiquitin/ISG15 ligase TRIM25-like [Salarias fasciatus]